jgi:hypothetical protein
MFWSRVAAPYWIIFEVEFLNKPNIVFKLLYCAPTHRPPFDSFLDWAEVETVMKTAVLLFLSVLELETPDYGKEKKPIMACNGLRKKYLNKLW